MAENTPAMATAGAPAGGANLTVIDSLTRLGVLRQVGIMLGLAASVALGFAVVLWSREPNYQALVSRVSPAEAAQIGNMLEQSKIEYRLDPDSGVVLVDSRRLTEAKVKLASSGLAPNPNPGYELLDNNQFGSSQFMESARYYRSVEGELARTISSMVNVREARVHLAIPKRSVFVGDERTPSASVFVSLGGSQTLDKSQVAAIIHLVASSVPEMQPKDVTVVDQRGQLLSGDALDETSLLSARQIEYQKTLEEGYIKHVNDILTPILGQGGFRVQLSADVDFSQVEQTSESFNPDLPALRSEQSVAESQSSGAGAQGVPGALSNQPPAAGTAPQTTAAAPNAAQTPAAATATSTAGSTSPSSQRQQQTKNYELDRTVSHLRQQVGALKHLSVAVVADNKFTLVPGAKGKNTSKRIPLTQQELDRLTLLVKDAVGFDATRGDRVTVINQPFVDAEALTSEQAAENVPFWQQEWFMNLVKQGLGALFVLILVFAVLRPILKNLSVRVEEGAGGAGEGDLAALKELGLEGGGGGHGDEKVTLTGESPDLMLPGPHEGFESQLAAVKAMIAEDPGRVAQVVKTWVNAEES